MDTYNQQLTRVMYILKACVSFCGIVLTYTSFHSERSKFKVQIHRDVFYVARY